jgi:hypothetical protein
MLILDKHCRRSAPGCAAIQNTAIDVMIARSLDVNIDCQTAQELIPAFLLDVLEAGEQTALLDHLRTCAACRTEADSLRAGTNQLGLAAPDAGEPAPRVKQRMLVVFRSGQAARKPTSTAPRVTWRWRLSSHQPLWRCC